MKEDIVIVAAKRTAMGAHHGQFENYSSPQLAAKVIAAIKSDIPIDEVIMGCVLPAGVGQAPARQAALFAGLNQNIPCTTINKVCGSGLKSVMFGFDAIRAGSAESILAGGMESMSQASQAHIIKDGLEDAYEAQTLMGCFTDRMAAQHGITREQQDDYATQSYQRALQAMENGVFEAELCEVDGITQDEPPAKVKFEKIPQLKPVFAPEGTITAANASSIADGAAAVILMPLSQAKSLALTPLARIVGHATHAGAPDEFSTAPIGAIEKLLSKVNWDKNEVDLYEINEAFAAVALAAIRALELDQDKVNIHGGSCALGHPLGATGARLLVTLTHALAYHQLSKGVVSLCLGGGEAVAMAIERM